jgi:TonB family protein
MAKLRSIFLAGSLMLVPFACSTVAQNEPAPEADIAVTHFEELRYPRTAWQARVHGLVVVRAKLDKEGKVVDAEAISGPQALIPDSLENIKKWRFNPNKQSTVVIVYSFQVLPADCAETNQQFFTLQLPNFVTVSACAIKLPIVRIRHFVD